MNSRYRARLASVCEAITTGGDVDEQLLLLEQRWREARTTAAAARAELMALESESQRDERAIIAAQMKASGTQEHQFLIIREIAELEESIRP